MTWRTEVPRQGSAYGHGFALFNPHIAHPFYRWENQEAQPEAILFRVGREWPLVPRVLQGLRGQAHLGRDTESG